MKKMRPAVNPRRLRSTSPVQKKGDQSKPADPPPRRLFPAPSLGAGRTPDRAPNADWELVICGDLSENQSELLAKVSELPRRSRGVIWFDSCGGSAYVGLALATMIRLRGLDATAVVAGECSSAAIMPFAACKRRSVSKHATLLFHPVRWHSEENVRREEAAEWARHFQVLEQALDDLLVEMLPMPADELERWTRPGRFISGEELITAGLAERIDLDSGDIWQQIKTAKSPA